MNEPDRRYDLHDLILERDQLKKELAEREHKFAAQRSKLFDAVIEITQIARQLARQLKLELVEANAKILVLKEKLEFANAGNVHSCHPECQNPPCVFRRERDEAREALKGLARALGFYGNPDSWSFVHSQERSSFLKDDLELIDPTEDYYAWKAGQYARKTLQDPLVQKVLKASKGGVE